MPHAMKAALVFTLFACGSAAAEDVAAYTLGALTASAEACGQQLDDAAVAAYVAREGSRNPEYFASELKRSEQDARDFLDGAPPKLLRRHCHSNATFGREFGLLRE